MQPQLYILAPNPDAGEGVYGEFKGPVVLDRIRPYLARGSVIAVRPLASSEWHEVADCIERVASRVINSPLVLWPDRVSTWEAAAIASKARLLGVRAVLWRAAPLTDSLRGQLADVDDWSRVLVVWLRRRGLRLSAEAEWAIQLLAARAPRHRFLGQLARTEGASEYRLKRHLEAIGVGSAHQWLVAVRIIRIALDIQWNATLKLEDLAYRFGFSSAAALGDRCWELIGARPSSIRSLLGWQWVLCDAARRVGLGLVHG